MPPKKPALTNARRTVAVGSHQILFSAPIQSASQPQQQRTRSRSQARRTSSSTGGPAARERSRSRTRPTEGSAGSATQGHTLSGKRRGLDTSAATAAASRVPAPPLPPPLASMVPSRVYEELAEVDLYVPSTLSSARRGLSPPAECDLLHGVARTGSAADRDAPTSDGNDNTNTSGTVGRLHPARMTRLLKNARATVHAPLRPETPLDLLKPTTDRGREAFLKGGVRVGRPRPAGSGAAAAAHRSPVHPTLASTTSLPSIASATGTTTPGSAGAGAVAGGGGWGAGGSAFLVALPPSVSDMNPDNFLACFVAAEGQPQRQVTLLRELQRWLANPRNTLRREWMIYFSEFLSGFNQRRQEVGGGSAGEGGGGCEAVVPADGETAVAVILTSVLLHNCCFADGRSVAPLAEMVALVRRLIATSVDAMSGVGASPPAGTAASFSPRSSLSSSLSRTSDVYQQKHQRRYTALMQWLERELIFEPLLRVASSEWVLTHHPHTVMDALDALCNVTRVSFTEPDTVISGSMTSAAAKTLRGEGGSPLDGTLNGGGRGATGDAVKHLVTVGALPTLNTLTRQLLAHMQDAILTRQRSGIQPDKPSLPSAIGDAPKEHAITVMRELIPELLAAICLIFRNLSADYGHLLLKLGTPSLLLTVLEASAHSPLMTAAVARTLAGLADDTECLRELQKDTKLIKAALTAISAQLPMHESIGSATEAQQGDRAMLLLSLARLCSVASQITEGAEPQQRYLAQYGTEVELAVLRFVTAPAQLATLGREEEDAIAENGEGEEAATTGPLTSVVQGALWLVGVTAMGEACPLPFVEEAATSLTFFLKRLMEESSGTAIHSESYRLTTVYTLMCLSNLSFYFPSIEARSDSGAIYLGELYGTLGFVLAAFLVGDDVEATVEATRTLGNVSFTNAGRDWIEANKCDEVVILFLGHEDLRVVYNSFGVMLNLTAATSCRAVSEEPALLRMLLQYTGRYTSRPAIDAAAREGARVMQRRRSSGESSSADGPLHEVAQGYADQIADLVEKCLSNIRGLLQADQQQD